MSQSEHNFSIPAQDRNSSLFLLVWFDIPGLYSSYLSCHTSICFPAHTFQHFVLSVLPPPFFFSAKYPVNAFSLKSSADCESELFLLLREADELRTSTSLTGDMNHCQQREAELLTDSHPESLSNQSTSLKIANKIRSWPTTQGRTG